MFTKMKQIDQYIQKSYEDYDDRVKVFLSRVFEDCKKNNEKLSNYFYVCLDLLAVQLKLYFMSLDIIDEKKKLSSEDSYKRVAKDPCIAILNHAHQEILNILQKLSLSPFEQAKLKRLNNGGDEEDAEDLLNKLIN